MATVVACLWPPDLFSFTALGVILPSKRPLHSTGSRCPVRRAPAALQHSPCCSRCRFWSLLREGKWWFKHVETLQHGPTMGEKGNMNGEDTTWKRDIWYFITICNNQWTDNIEIYYVYCNKSNISPPRWYLNLGLSEKWYMGFGISNSENQFWEAQQGNLYAFLPWSRWDNYVFFEESHLLTGLEASLPPQNG